MNSHFKQCYNIHFQYQLQDESSLNFGLNEITYNSKVRLPKLIKKVYKSIGFSIDFSRICAQRSPSRMNNKDFHLSESKFGFQTRYTRLESMLLFSLGFLKLDFFKDTHKSRTLSLVHNILSATMPKYIIPSFFLRQMFEFKQF